MYIYIFIKTHIRAHSLGLQINYISTMLVLVLVPVLVRRRWVSPGDCQWPRENAEVSPEEFPRAALRAQLHSREPCVDTIQMFQKVIEVSCAGGENKLWTALWQYNTPLKQYNKLCSNTIQACGSKMQPCNSIIKPCSTIMQPYNSIILPYSNTIQS